MILQMIKTGKRAAKKCRRSFKEKAQGQDDREKSKACKEQIYQGDIGGFYAFSIKLLQIFRKGV